MMGISSEITVRMPFIQTLNTQLRLIGFTFHQNRKISPQPVGLSLSFQPQTKVPLSKNINYCSIVSTVIFSLKDESKIRVVFELITVRQNQKA